MDYLQEKLLGEKVAVSPMILALTQNIQLSEAERVLSEFYDIHKQRLDASYQVTTKVGMKTTVRIIGPQDLPNDGSIARIYIVSTERATDTAVIDEVARRASELQFHLTIGDLKKVGYYVNPMLGSDFSVRTSGRLFGPISAELGNHAPKSSSSEAAHGTTKPVANIKSEMNTSKALKREPDEKTNVKVEEQQPEPKLAQDKLPEAIPQKRPSTTKSSSQVKRPANFPFSKVDKAEALAFNRQRAPPPPVHEKVVISGSADNDDDDDDQNEQEQDDSDEQRLRASKAAQLEKLNRLYDDDAVSNEQHTMATSHADTDEELPDEPEPEPEPEPEMDMDPLVDDHENNGDTEPQGNAAVPDSNNKIQRLNPSESAPKGKPTRKVLRTIITKDEEGFDVRQQVYVDEEIDPNELVNDEIKPNSADQTSESSSSTSAHSLPKAKPEKKKIQTPPTIRKGNQTNLMSFFSKK